MLTGKQKRVLRSQGSHLKPAVALGKDGLTDAVIEETRRQLDSGELVKVRIHPNSLLPVPEAARDLANRTGSELVGVTGGTALLFSPKKKDSAFDLP